MGLSPGQKLQNGKYTVVRQLGRGRFGITYWVDRDDGERWSIEILDPQVLAGLTEVERDRTQTQFWQKAVKLAKCSGTPHIVQAEMPFKENTKTGAVICLPMAYADGNSLGDRGQRRLVEATALEYIRQIGQALMVVHAADIVHRDICPGNIVLRIRRDRTVEALLTHFDLAMTDNTALSRTRENELSHGFAPIELYGRGQPVGPYTDVYSLAATLYELLAGEVPEPANARKVSGQPLPSPQLKNPEISDRTAKAILAGMQLQPDERPQTVTAWFKLLGLKPKGAASSASAPANWGKWQAIWAAAAVVVTLILGIVSIGLSLRKSDSPSQPQPSPTESSTPKPSPQK